MKINNFLFFSLYLLFNSCFGQTTNANKDSFTMKELLKLHSMPFPDKISFILKKNFKQDIDDSFMGKKGVIEIGMKKSFESNNVQSWMLFDENEYNKCLNEMIFITPFKFENSQQIKYKDAENKQQTFILKLKEGEHVFYINKSQTVIVFSNKMIRGMGIIGIMQLDQLYDYLN